MTTNPDDSALLNVGTPTPKVVGAELQWLSRYNFSIQSLPKILQQPFPVSASAQ